MAGALPYLAALAFAGVVAGYSRAAKATLTPGAKLPTAAPTGLPEIDQLVVTATSMGFDTCARTIWAEARGEGYTGMQAVVNVIMNRLRVSKATPGGMWWGNTLEEICLAPKQFSAWNLGDANRAAALKVTPADLQFRQAQELTLKAIGGLLPDITYGATHYHAVGIYPSWAAASKRLASIGSHVFYA